MIRVQNLSKSYGSQEVFDGVEFLMTPRERLGFVGRNGRGKTTLFRLLLGEEQIDGGEIIMPSGYRVGCLSQHLVFHEANILDEVTSVLGDRVSTERYRAEAALMGLGFTRDDLARPASEFSGGYQIRVNLARALVEEPNLLLLDEPTNHLDIVSVRWLTRFLRGWRNELMIISHDRRFLSNVCTHSMVVHRGKLRRMQGSVEKLYGQIATDEEVYEASRANEAKKRRQEERFIERFRAKASKASLVKSRIKALERRGKVDALENEAELAFSFSNAPFHSTNMMVVEQLGFGYPGGSELINALNLTIEKGDRLAIIGPNGRGKTTLLNLLAGELSPNRGTVRNNPNTAIAYFGQTNIDRLHPDMTVEQELQSARPEQTRSQVRGLAGLLMFSGATAEKPISVLSGGERSRVLLGKLLVSPANLLLLDEPTNHLDIESIEGLLDAVDAFEGSVLLVTHSEMILERVATRLVVFDGGKVTHFEGGYRDFLERVGWQDEAGQGGQPGKAGSAGGKTGAKGNSKEQRRKRAEIVKARARATGGLKKATDRLEREIMDLEREVASLDAAMERAAEAGRNEELVKLATDAAGKRAAIDEQFIKLEHATEELDRARARFEQQLSDLDSKGS